MSSNATTLASSLSSKAQQLASTRINTRWGVVITGYKSDRKSLSLTFTATVPMEVKAAHRSFHDCVETFAGANSELVLGNLNDVITEAMSNGLGTAEKGGLKVTLSRWRAGQIGNGTVDVTYEATE